MKKILQHPGNSVKKQCIDKPKLSVTQAAAKLGVDRTTFSRLINGRAGISAEMALRLSLALGRPIGYWMKLQSDYDLAVVMKMRKKIKVKKIKP